MIYIGHNHTFTPLPMQRKKAIAGLVFMPSTSQIETDIKVLETEVEGLGEEVKGLESRLEKVISKPSNPLL